MMGAATTNPEKTRHGAPAVAKARDCREFADAAEALLCSTGAMSDFATALRRIRRHGEGILDDAAQMLRQLVVDTCEAISAAEGSILVPTDDETELRFLVSMNPSLEEASITVPLGASVSGYVFSSRQAMAKIHPDSPGANAVDKVADVETKYLLAVPIIDDDRVYGVATFVNRSESAGDEPFSISDLKMAQGFGEIYATGMKLYRKIEFSLGMARLEIADHAREFGIDGMEDEGLSEAAANRLRIPALLAEKALSLPEKEREMLLRIAELFDEHAESADELADDASDEGDAWQGPDADGQASSRRDRETY